MYMVVQNVPFKRSQFYKIFLYWSNLIWWTAQFKTIAYVSSHLFNLAIVVRDWMNMLIH